MDYTKYPGKKLENYGKLLNTSKPIISIVTPYYNADKTIDETFNSIMNQTYPFFEWIIVDDGSPDKNASKKLDELQKKDKRIKVFKKENGGPAQARDYGIEKTASSSKYVFFLDSDDLIDKTTLECLYWALETNKDASFAYTTVVNFGAREFLWEKYFTVAQEKEENLITVSSLVRKEDLIEVGCFGIKEKSMYEDWNLWLKLIRAGKKPLRVNAPLFWYRQTENGEFSRAKKNNDNAMKYVNETASQIDDNQLEAIQYPRYGDNYATCTEEFDMILPDYEKDDRRVVLYLFPWMVVGGADFFNLDLIKRLPQDKYRAIILTTTPSNNPIRQMFEDYAEIYDMSSFMDRINYVNFADYMIKSRKVDIVFVSNTEYGYYMTPYLKSKYPTIPFIDYIHCVDIHDPRKGFARCSRDVTKYLSRTYCCNNSTLRELKEDFGIPNAETIYIGTDEKKFDPAKFDKESLKDKYGIPKDRIIISFICRLSEQKRPEMFVEIAKRVSKRDKRIFWVVAGDGPLMPQVRANVDENFKLLGMIKETGEIYALSDITFNCSSFEGLALTSYESLSMGVPVVSTDAGGQAELINETVGGLVHFNENPTPEVFEQEIEQYVEETIRVVNNLDKLKKNCRKRIIEGFTLDLMAKKFDKIFDEIIKEEKNTKLEQQDTTVYEVACESFNRLFYNYTNEYYERNLGIYLNANTSKHQKTYNKIRRRLEQYGAVNEGKDIVEFLRHIKISIKESIICFKKFIKAFLAGFVVLFKMIKYYLKKLIRK